MIIIIIFWLACGLIAAGWMKADFDTIEERPENRLALFLLVTGLCSLIWVAFARITSQEAHGWKWPFSGANIQGHWFKRRDK